jgi:hypothetical protein
MGWRSCHDKGIVMKIILLTLLTCLLTGCAGIDIDKKTGSIKAYGFFRTVTEKKTYYKDGSIKEHTVSTDSTTKDVLLGLDKLVDSAVNTAAKIKP